MRTFFDTLSGLKSNEGNLTKKVTSHFISYTLLIGYGKNHRIDSVSFVEQSDHIYVRIFLSKI